MRGKKIAEILKLRTMDLSGLNPDMDPKLYEQILEARRKEARDKKTRLILRDGTVEDYTI